jgi:hypothetical protein
VGQAQAQLTCPGACLESRPTIAVALGVFNETLQCMVESVWGRVCDPPTEYEGAMLDMLQVLMGLLALQA